MKIERVSGEQLSISSELPNIASDRMAVLKCTQGIMNKLNPPATTAAKPVLRKLHFILCAGFTGVGFASWVGLVWSRHTDHWNLVGPFAFVCWICLIGATQSIAFPLAGKYRNARRLR